MTNRIIIACGFLAALAALFPACPAGNTDNSPGVLSIVILDASGNAFSGDQINGTIGGSVQFKSEVQVINGAAETARWSVAGGNGVSSISAGKLTIGGNETPGTILTVTVTADADTSKSASMKVQAVAPLPPTYYAINNTGLFTYGSVAVRNGLTQATQGTPITLDITPDTDYQLEADALTVTRTSSGTRVTVNGNGNIRTFIMPPAAVTINATFSKVFNFAEYSSDDFDASLCSFYDKFDGTGGNVNANGLDRAKWGYQNGWGQNGWGNWEAQNYQGDTNAIVANGILSLIAEKRQVGGQQYASAKLVSATGDGNTPSQPFSQVYGRFEARMRMSKAEPGMWPAWWMMPLSDSAYGGWPRSGEIDIMEMKGRLSRESSSTIHVHPGSGPPPSSRYRGANVHFPGTSDITDWHVYGVQWEPESITFLFDGMQHTKINRSQWNTSFYQGKGWPNTAPFDKNFFFILNLAVGGTFDIVDGVQQMPRDSELPISLDIDWVRVYTLENNPWPIQPLAGSGYTSIPYNN